MEVAHKELEADKIEEKKNAYKLITLTMCIPLGTISGVYDPFGCIPLMDVELLAPPAPPLMTGVNCCHVDACEPELLGWSG